MGLDAVELVMSCEDAFGISIPDEAASKVVTVGDLHELILKLTAERAAGPTRTSSAAFYRLRQGLVACGVERDRVLPTSRLDDLLPVQQRRVLWTQLARATGIKLPALRRPRWVLWMSLACAAASGVAAWAVSRSGTVGFVAAVGIACLLGPCTRPLRQEFPGTCHTVENLIYVVIGRRENALVPPQGLGPRETWCVLRKIIAELVAVPEEEIQPHSRFVQDLKMD